jgi:hypothetical protein
MMSAKNSGVGQAGFDLGLTPLATTPQEDEETKRKRLQQQQLSRPNLPATNALFGEGV